MLLELFKKYGSETFTSLPTFAEAVHELLDICAESCNSVEVSNTLMTKVLLKIAERSSYISDEYEQTYHFLRYLIDRRRVDVNAMSESEFKQLMECFKYSLTYFCSLFSTPVTGVFLHVTLNPTKLNLLWEFVIENVLFSIGEEMFELVHSFLRNGFDAGNALFLTITDPWVHDGISPRNFSYLLELVELYMDNGARLNPFPNSPQALFLQKILIVHSVIDGERPEMLGFIKMCTHRGMDPKVTGCLKDEREDLLMTVCRYYNADDLSEVIEFLYSRGAHSSLYTNSGAGVWSRLLCSSNRRQLTLPCFNKTILTLIRRGLRTYYVDPEGNNLLYLFLYWDSNDFRGGCCRYGWLRKLTESKYWNVLHTLLDAGVQASHVNKHGETPLHALLNSILRCTKFLEEPVCFMCCREHFGRKHSTMGDSSGIRHFFDVLKFIDRLLKAIPKTLMEIWKKYERFPVLIRSHFRGEEQSALIQVLSRNGISGSSVLAKATKST